MTMKKSIPFPEEITVFPDSSGGIFFSSSGEKDGVRFFTAEKDGGVSFAVASARPLKYLRLHWHRCFEPETLFCGDAWERSYGDLQWRTCDPARVMPWYFFANCGGVTEAFGVKVRPNVFAAWRCEPGGVTLWLDLRSGSDALELEGRKLELATVVFERFEDCSAFAAARKFCGILCDDPILPSAPVYGSNNWYYAYGKISQESVLQDADFLNRLTQNLPNRPFLVVDDGWEREYDGCYNGGPWDAGNNKFPDMKRMADEIRSRGVRPGIWYRPLYCDAARIGERLAAECTLPGRPDVLDPSTAGGLEIVRSDIRRIADWGYELIKHDFSTVDLFCRYGYAMHFFPALNGVSFHDRKRTSAEIVKDFYRALHTEAGKALIMGCNTIGHLGAGLMQLARTGDDTSGVKWERTRKMGVNTLAFRLCQNGTFFNGDADCVGNAGGVPWRLNRQWSKLVAESGTAYFYSIPSGVLTGDEEAELRNHLKIASEGGKRIEALDWRNSTVPGRWQIGESEQGFDWFDSKEDSPDFL